MKTLVKILLWTVAVVIGLPLLVLCLSPLWRKPWIEPLPGVRLTPARPVVAEKDLPPDSAFMRFRKAEKAFVKPGTQGIDKEKFQAEAKKLFLVPWSEEAFPVLVKALAANGDALRLAREAIAAPSSQVPSLIGFDTKADYLMRAQEMSRLLNASAARNFQNGSMEATLGDLLSMIRLGDMFTRGSPLLSRLVDAAVAKSALSSVRRAILASDVPPEVAGKFVKDITEIENNLDPWAETFRWESLLVPEAVKNLYSNNGPEKLRCLVNGSDAPKHPEDSTSPFGYRPMAWLALSTSETTKANLESAYAHLIKFAETPEDASACDNFIQAFEAQYEGKHTFWKVQDPLGFLYAQLFVPWHKHVNFRHAERIAALRATQAVIAIRQFQQANARPPESLGELVPQFLPSVPEDPFDHKPLRYIRKSDTAWAVYSVGRNRIDDGGKEPKSNRSSDKREADLVFSSTEAADALAKLNAEKPSR